MKIDVWTTNGQPQIQYSVFPAGEQYVKIIDTNMIKDNLMIFVHIYSADSSTLMTSIMLADAIRILNPKATITAKFDYLPYGRQDRDCSEGESFSLNVFYEMLKLRYDVIETFDLHSDVMRGYINDVNKDITKLQFIDKNSNKNLISELLPKDFVVVQPDAGAKDRSNIFAELFNKDILVLDKTRTQNGITQKIVKYIDAENYVIYDDICDGGGTFIQAYNCIKERNKNAKVYLVVSHGIFSKGLEVLNMFENIIVPLNKFNQLNQLNIGKD